MDVHRGELAVKVAAVLRQEPEVALRRRRHRLDHAFQRIRIDAVQQVESEDGHLGVGQEERVDLSLRQVA